MPSTKCKIELQEKVGFKWIFQVEEVLSTTSKLSKKAKDGIRRCEECDKQLSRYNKSSLCFTCQKVLSPMYNYLVVTLLIM